MNTAIAKVNFTKYEANLYSWQLNTIEPPYHKNSLSDCEQYLQEPSILLG